MPKLSEKIKPLGLPFALLTASLILTLFVWHASCSAVKEQLQSRFEKEVDSSVLLFKDHLELYFDFLYSARNFFTASKTAVERGEWSLFTDPATVLSRFPGMMGTEYIKRIKNEDAAKYTEETIKDKTVSPAGYPDFKIYPEAALEEYYVTHFFAPGQENFSGQGFNVLSDPVRREAFERARDTGRIVVTGILPSFLKKSEDESQKHFMIIIPIYTAGKDTSAVASRRENLEGFVDVLCNVDRLTKHIFSNRAIHSDIDFDIFDGKELVESQTLSLDPRGEELIKKGYVPPFSAIRNLDVGGRIWTLRFVSLPEFRPSPIARIFPAFVFAAGTALSLMLFLVLWSLSTSRQRAVQLAESMTQNLREEVRERKKAESEALRALSVKSEFLSIVSHELRTPLTVIQESLGIVKEESAGPLTDDQKDFLETAERNVGRLSRLINDVLDLQKLEAGKMEYHKSLQSLNGLIEETVKSFEPIAKGRGVLFSLSLAADVPPVLFDRDRLTQVLSNLFDNAIKFSGKGKVTVKTEKKNGKVFVSVRDEGMGIRKEDMPRLFQSFSQIAPAKGRKPGGTGLGLVISKQIVEEHGGQISADSVFGKGTVFTFWLPLEK